jgi:hypothetical protein
VFVLEYQVEASNYLSVPRMFRTKIMENSGANISCPIHFTGCSGQLKDKVIPVLN